MKLVFSQFFISSLLSLLFLIFHVGFRRCVSARGKFLGGIILVFFFLIPIRLPLIELPVSSESIFEESIPIFSGEEYGNDVILSENTLSERPAVPMEYPSENEIAPSFFPQILLLGVYLFGVLFMLFRTTHRYGQTVRTMLRCGRAPHEHEWLRWRCFCEKAGVARTPRLLLCPPSVLPSPIMFGIFRRTVMISDETPEKDAEMLLGHELAHCKRHDPLWKMLLAFLRALYWFHPLVRLFIRTMHMLCEEACDEAYLIRKDEAEKRDYCKLLVLTAASPNDDRFAVFTAFKGGKSQMKQRLQNILTKKNHKLTLIFVSVLLVVALLSVGVYAATTPAKSDAEKESTSADVYYYSEEEIKEKNDQMVKNHLEWFGIDLSEDIANPEYSVAHRTDGFVRAGRYNGAEAMLTPDGEPIIYLAVDGQLWKLDYTPGLVENGIGINYVSNGDGTGTVEYVNMKTVLDEFIYNFSWASLRNEEGYPAENGSDYDAFYRDLKAFCDEHAHEDIGSPYPFYGPTFQFFTTLYNRADIQIPS